MSRMNESWRPAQVVRRGRPPALPRPPPARRATTRGLSASATPQAKRSSEIPTQPRVPVVGQPIGAKQAPGFELGRTLGLPSAFRGFRFAQKLPTRNGCSRFLIVRDLESQPREELILKTPLPGHEDRFVAAVEAQAKLAQARRVKQHSWLSLQLMWRGGADEVEPRDLRSAELPSVHHGRGPTGTPYTLTKPLESDFPQPAGHTLGEALTDTREPLTVAERLCAFLPAFSQLCALVDEAHSAGVVFGGALSSQNLRLQGGQLHFEGWDLLHCEGAQTLGSDGAPPPSRAADRRALGELLWQIVLGQRTPSSRIVQSQSTHGPARWLALRRAWPSQVESLLTPEHQAALEDLLLALPVRGIAAAPDFRPRPEIDLGQVCKRANQLRHDLLEAAASAANHSIVPLSALDRDSEGHRFESLEQFVNRHRFLRGRPLPAASIVQIFAGLHAELDVRHCQDRYGGLAPSELLHRVGKGLELGPSRSVEGRGDAHHARSAWADYQSLGRSLWVMLTGQECPLRAGQSHSLRDAWYLSRLPAQVEERFGRRDAQLMQALIDCCLPPRGNYHTAYIRITKLLNHGLPDMPAWVALTPGVSVRWLEDEFDELQMIAKGGEVEVYTARRRSDGRLVKLRMPHVVANHLATHFAAEFRAQGGQFDLPEGSPRISLESSDRGEALKRRVETGWTGHDNPEPERVYTHDGRVAYVSEYVRGTRLTFARNNRNAPALPMGIALDWAIELFGRLNEAHRVGVVHRDLKPENLLIDIHGHLRLTDYGIAAMVGERSANELGTISGSPSYIAASQCDPDALVEPSSDFYSAAVLLFVLLTREHPLQTPGGSPNRVRPIVFIAAQNDGERKRLVDLRPDAPLQFSELLGQMLLRDPADRPESAAMVSARLREIRQRYLRDEAEERQYRAFVGSLIEQEVVVHHGLGDLRAQDGDWPTPVAA